MVRLVFRPYTHVRRTICTSVSLRSSTRVSSGFNLHKHSSPPFGSQRMYSCLAFHRRSCAACDEYREDTFTVCFRFVLRFTTFALAHTLDSLARVSRRVKSARRTGGLEHTKTDCPRCKCIEETELCNETPRHLQCDSTMPEGVYCVPRLGNCLESIHSKSAHQLLP